MPLDDFVNSTFSASSSPAGIGILLYASINQFQWREVSLVLLDVFVVVVISEFI